MPKENRPDLSPRLSVRSFFSFSIEWSQDAAGGRQTQTEADTGGRMPISNETASGHLAFTKSCAMSSAGAPVQARRRSCKIDTPLTDLTKRMGKAEADRAGQVCSESIGKIADLCDEIGEVCGFAWKSSVSLASREKDVPGLHAEFAARRAAGDRGRLGLRVLRIRRRLL